MISDWIKVRVTSDPGHSFLDRMIALVEGAERQKTPNEIALNILLAVLTLVFLLVVVTLQPFALYAGTTIRVLDDTSPASTTIERPSAFRRASDATAPRRPVLPL